MKTLLVLLLAVTQHTDWCVPTLDAYPPPWDFCPEDCVGCVVDQECYETKYPECSGAYHRRLADVLIEACAEQRRIISIFVSQYEECETLYQECVQQGVKTPAQCKQKYYECVEDAAEQAMEARDQLDSNTEAAIDDAQNTYRACMQECCYEPEQNTFSPRGVLKL